VQIHWNPVYKAFHRIRSYGNKPIYQKIIRVCICRLKQHYMSHKALYGTQYFIKSSAYVVLFKAYPTYIFSLDDMFFKRQIMFNNILYQTTYFVQQHILLFNIYGLYDMFVQQHIYVFKQHVCAIEFYRTYLCHVSLNNLYVILM